MKDKDGSAWRPFDYQKGKQAAKAAATAAPGKGSKSRPGAFALQRPRRWSQGLVDALETSKVGHSVVKKDARALVKRAQQWLHRTLQAAAAAAKRASKSGGGDHEALASSDEEDLEAAAAAGRAQRERMHAAAVPEENLLPEVYRGWGLYLFLRPTKPVRHRQPEGPLPMVAPTYEYVAPPTPLHCVLFLLLFSNLSFFLPAPQM